MIDVDSFVDYFIINELSSNADAGNYSTYIYKGTDNLYRMCVWDFNNACNNYFEEELPYTGFFLNNRLWFEMLIKDEDFTERIIQRYHSLRKGLLSEESLYRYIDETMHDGEVWNSRQRDFWFRYREILTVDLPLKDS